MLSCMMACPPHALFLTKSIYDLKLTYYRAHIFNKLILKYKSEMVHDHLLRMPNSKWADHENITGANKLAYPSIVD